MVIAGLHLRWWAIITLGRFFTVDVTIEKDHELVERGPFRVVPALGNLDS
jgi:protein-S-isoprenylcysteine O-methyltransferase